MKGKANDAKIPSERKIESFSVNSENKPHRNMYSSLSSIDTFKENQP